MKILVTPTSLQPDKNPAALKVLQDFSKNLIFNPTGKPLSEEELIPLLKGGLASHEGADLGCLASTSH